MVEMRTLRPGRCRIGLFGTFDIDNLGDALFPRIARMELARRLPDATIRAFSPIGHERLTRFDGGEPSEPLGAYGPDRVAELAGELDCVIVGGGEIVHGRDELLGPIYGMASDTMIERAPSRFFIDGLGPELEARCPVVWHAVGIPFDVDPDEAGRYRRALASRPYVSVRDDASRRRLERAGVDREIEVVPDPAVLLPRLIPDEVLDRRLAYLRGAGAFPDDAPALVVQGSRTLLDASADLAAAVARLAEEQDAEVVLVESGPVHGDAELADALAGALSRPARRVSGGVEDVLAAIRGSAGFVGSSLHGNIAALVYGRPHVVLGWGGESKLDAFARSIDREEALVTSPDDVPAAFAKVAARGSQDELVAALHRDADRHFDRLATIAADAAERRGDERDDEPTPAQLREHYGALRASNAAFARRVAAERMRLAERVEEREAERRRDVAKLEAEIRRRDEELARARQEVVDERARREAEVGAREEQLRTLLNTKTFRYTAALRRLWGRLRGRKPS